MKGFDSDKVNASDTAYGWGMPDLPISIAAHSVSLALATTGSKERVQKQPWLPLLATAVALPPAVTAAKYLFYQMSVKEKGWYPYYITDAYGGAWLFRVGGKKGHYRSSRRKSRDQIC